MRAWLRQFSLPLRLFGLPLAVTTAALLIGIAVTDVFSRSSENRELACSTADLIAHVPAVQFEGESLSNFIGWIEARHDVLRAAQDAQTCDPEIITALEKRQAADSKLVEQIRRTRQER